MTTATSSSITFVDKCNSPIGVFDSGLGGLSVLTHLVERLPFEHFIYLADTLHVPYGSRDSKDIEQLTLQAVDWLVEQSCKLVVIACNTASAHGLQAVRERYPNLLIVGLVPALKPAVLKSMTKKVAVLATPATLHGELLNEVIEQIAVPKGVKVHKYSFVSLVPWVEAGMPSEHLAVSELDSLLKTLIADHIDYLVLGCTHYPFFKAYLQQKIAQLLPINRATPLNLIDSGEAIARRVSSLLEQESLQQQSSQQKSQVKQANLSTPNLPTIRFFSTANLAITQTVAERLLLQFLPNRSVQFYQIAY